MKTMKTYMDQINRETKNKNIAEATNTEIEALWQDMKTVKFKAEDLAKNEDSSYGKKMLKNVAKALQSALMKLDI